MEVKDLEVFREEVTCPICLDIPREGDLLRCPNSHLICEQDYLQLPSPKICPECRAHYGPVGQSSSSIPSGAIRCKIANKILAIVPIQCRFVERGCAIELTRDKLRDHETTCPNRFIKCRYASLGCKDSLEEEALAAHEKSCSFEPKKCKYAAHGCKEIVIKSKLQAHEESCGFEPFCCVLMHCSDRMPLSRLLPHLKASPLRLVHTKAPDGEFNGTFAMDHVVIMTEFTEWPGVVVEYDKRHFYFGLTRWQHDKTWLVSATIFGLPDVAKQYRVEITANNPKKKGYHLSYDGPVNSLKSFAAGKPREEFVGLCFPNKIADDLINVHSNTKKRVIGIICRLAKGTSF